MSEPSDWSLSKGAERVIFDGETVRKLEDSAVSGGCYPSSIGFYPSAYRHEMQRLHHDDYLLMYCVAGSGSLATALERTDIFTGDLVLLPPGVSHQYAASESDPWSLFWVHFDGECAKDFCSYIGIQSTKYVLHGLTDVNLQSAFYHLLNVAKAAYDWEHKVLLANQLRQVLSQIGCSRSGLGESSPESQIFAVREFLVGNIDRRISLDELLSLTNYSKYHFVRQYKRHTGYSPLRHFELLKIDQAKIMLESSSLAISEIANQLAFDDPLYFSRVFRKNEGVSPREYRARKRNHAIPVL